MEKFPSLALPRNAIMLILLSNFRFIMTIICSGRLREVENKTNFQTFGSESGRSRLQDVPEIVI